MKLVTEQGYSVAEACRSLDIGETALRRWMAQMKSGENGSVLPGTKPLTEEQQRIHELEKKVKRLEQEKMILRKATAILTSGEWLGTNS